MSLEIRDHFSVFHICIHAFNQKPHCTMEVPKTNFSVRIQPNKSHFYEKECIFSRGFVWRKERAAWLPLRCTFSIYFPETGRTIHVFMLTSSTKCKSPYFLSLNTRIYLLTLVRGGEEGREREALMWERNIIQLPPVPALTGNWTPNLGMCPDRGIETTALWYMGWCFNQLSNLVRASRPFWQHTGNKNAFLDFQEVNNWHINFHESITGSIHENERNKWNKV